MPPTLNFLLPIIKDLERRNPKGKSNAGIVDLVLFDGATNIKNPGNIMATKYPQVTVLHRREHVVSLISKDLYKKITEFGLLWNFTRQARNMFGSTRHEPTAMFGNYSKNHNKVIIIGFIKPCDVRIWTVQALA